jgi:predicted transport protein
VREEFRSEYIAYKSITNFVDIEPQKSNLKIWLNMKFSEVNDPLGLCRNVSNIGHHGNGEVELTIGSLDRLDDVMELIQQAFEEQ